jgi:hypothetical protein
MGRWSGAVGACFARQYRGTFSNIAGDFDSPMKEKCHGQLK